MNVSSPSVAHRLDWHSLLSSVDVSRLWFVTGTLIYIAVFVGTYFAFTASSWDYWGMGIDPNWRAAEMLLFVALALWPAFLLPAKVQRPSDMFLMLQYSLVYVPTLFLAQHSRLPVLDSESRNVLYLALTIGMAIMIWARRTWRPLKLPWLAVRPGLLWTGLFVLLSLSLVALTALLGGNFRLVRLDEIYDVRSGVDEIIEASGSHLGGYPFFWANNVFLPLLFAYAMFRRSVAWMLVVILGFVFLFGVWGAKMSLLAPIYLLLFFLVLGLRQSLIMPAIFVGMSSLLLVPMFMPNVGLLGVVREWWIAIVHARTFTIPSLLVVQYLDFFQQHPLTFGSHITGINLLIDYPYDIDISRTVGYHYYGHLVTSNVNFWAQDGIAGIGAAGVPLASLIASIVLWFADSAAAGLRMRFVGTALGAVFLAFLTTSIFTTLLTGGLFLISVFFWLLPRDGRGFWLPEQAKATRAVR
jgi:hypothetical protein